jgi:uncharacterized membrane protein YkvA (DUF1232 family)
MSIKESIRSWARRIKRDALMLWFAQRHPDTPPIARAICLLAVAYALSPIDLVPDFIPVLGYIDDAILLPAMIWLAVRLLPAAVVEACRARADEWMAEQGRKPTSYLGAALVAGVWLCAMYLCWRLFTGLAVSA